MITLKEVSEKRATHLKEVQEVFVKHLHRFNEIFAPSLLVANKIYSFLNGIASKFFDFLSIIIRLSSRSLLYLADKSIALGHYTHRKIYVWRVLSVRKQWYKNKKGELYNPKLKATISPCWEVTWNMTRLNNEYRGITSKEEAQDLAFKMWMKKRRLKNRLEIRDIEMKLPLNLSQKVLPNKIKLRKATPTDVSVLLSFMEECGHARDEKMKARIDAYAYGSYNHIVIAERGKKLVGFIAFVLYDLFLSEGKRCHIEEIFIEGNPTDLGIKRKLLEAVEVFARDNNSKIIDMTAGLHTSKDHAQDFYKFLGYDNDNSKGKMYFQKEL